MILKSPSPEEMRPSPQGQLRAMLNGAKVLEPLLTGLLRHPGLAEDEEKLSKATVEITALHRTVTEKVLETLCPNDNHPAARATFGSSLAYLVGQAWTHNPDGVDAEALAQAFIQTVQISEPRPDEAFEPLPRATDEALVAARAVSRCLPVLMRLDRMGARSLFVGSQDMSTLTNLLRDEIQERARTIADALIPAGTQDDQQWAAYKSILSRVASVTAQVLEMEFNGLGRELKDMAENAQKKQAFLADLPNHPCGVLTTRVLDQVDKALADLFPAAFRSRMKEDDSADHRPS